MKALLTSRADIEVFGKVSEKEDIVPVDFEENPDNVSFRIRKAEFINRLIDKSEIFALNVPKRPFENEADICEMHEGEFEDKFELAKFERLECNTIDCSCIGKSTVYECVFHKKEEDKDGFLIIGKVLTKRDI